MNGKKCEHMFDNLKLKTDSLAPIVLFVYNRPWHTKKALQALKENDLADQSILYIYSILLIFSPEAEDISPGGPTLTACNEPVRAQIMNKIP